VVKKISEQARTNTSEFVGTKLFRAKMLREVFRNKKINAMRNSFKFLILMMEGHLSRIL